MANDTRNAVSDAEYNEEFEMITLPIEIIKNILMYVDDHSRPNVSLVCHTFYELICELERDKGPLELRYSEVKYFFLSQPVDLLPAMKMNSRSTMTTSTNR